MFFSISLIVALSCAIVLELRRLTAISSLFLSSLSFSGVVGTNYLRIFALGIGSGF